MKFQGVWYLIRKGCK